MRPPTHTEFAARRRTVAVSSHLTMSNSPHFFVPAAQFCARGFATLLRSPQSRGGRSAEKRSGACEAPVGHAVTRQDARERADDAACQALARRLASPDAGRSPLGAPPWRFFTRGRASLSAALLTLTLRLAVGSVTASSSLPGRSAWRAGSRASPGKRLRAAAGRTPHLAPPWIASRRRPSMSKATNLSSTGTIRSQYRS
jgi:hypothetical protein